MLEGPVDKEETWSALSTSNATELDNCVYQALLKVPMKEVTAPIRAIEPEQFEEAQREATAALARLVGKTVTARKASAVDTARTLADLKAGIRNDQTIDSHRLYRLPSGDLSKYWLSGNGPLKAISMLGIDDLASSEWLLELATGEVTALARASYVDYKKVLTMRAQLALAGPPIPELPTMARIDDLRRFGDVYNELASFFKVELQDSFLDLLSHNLHWYIAGDLRAWWQELREYGPMRVLPLVPLPTSALTNWKPIQSKEEAYRLLELAESRSVDDAHSHSVSGGKSLFVCEFDRLVGRFVHAFPPYAIGSFFDVIGRDFELFALDERDDVAEGVWSLLALAERVWATL